MEEVVQVEEVHRGDGSTADKQPSAGTATAAGEIRLRQRNISDHDPEPRCEDAILVVLPRWRLRRERKPQGRQQRQHVEGFLVGVRGQLIGAGC